MVEQQQIRHHMHGSRHCALVAMVQYRQRGVPVDLAAMV
jgi:hypothetical protein